MKIPRRIKWVLATEHMGAADERHMRYFHRWFERFSDDRATQRRLQRFYARLLPFPTATKGPPDAGRGQGVTRTAVTP